MTINELKEMKRFPKDKAVVSAAEKAVITICRIPHSVDKKGKVKYIYEGQVHFVYANGKQYRTDFRESSLKLTIKKTMQSFEQRNKQMLNYEKRGLNLNVSS